MFMNLNATALYIDAPLHELLKLAKTTGFEGVDVNIAEVTKLATKKSLDYVKQLFLNAALKSGGWLLPVGWHENGDRSSFWHRKTKYEADLEVLPSLARTARHFGCVRALTWVLSYSDDKPFQENFNWHVSRLQPIAEILRKQGCRLALEFMGPKTLRVGHKYEFICTIDGMLTLCDAIGIDNVGLLLDSWHWYSSRGTLEDLRQLSSHQIVYVHVNDALTGVPIDEQVDGIRCLPGETNVIDLIGFLRALKEIGFDGPITPEPFSEKLKMMSPSEAVRVTHRMLSRVWQEAAL